MLLRAMRPVFLRRALTNIDKTEFVKLSADPNVVVIDVRDINEVKGGTIPAANWNHIARLGAKKMSFFRAYFSALFAFQMNKLIERFILTIHVNMF